MYCLEIPEDGKPVVHFHEELSEQKLFDCADQESAWVTEDQTDTSFHHYQDIDWHSFKHYGHESRRCPVCFAKPSEFDQIGSVHVVIYAQDCVAPQVFVTHDADLARWQYLVWDEHSDDNDLITWQSEAIWQKKE